MMNSTLTYSISENYTFFLAALKVAENEVIDPPVDFLGEAYVDDFKSAFLADLEERRPYTVDPATLRVAFWGFVTKEEAKDEVYPCCRPGDAIIHVVGTCHSESLGDWEARASITGDLGSWYIPF